MTAPQAGWRSARGGVATTLATLIAALSLAHASGPQRVTFRQPADCALVDHWELYFAPGTVLPGDPSGRLTGEIKNPTPQTCTGSDMIAIVPLVGAAKAGTFWLVARTADGLAATSNAVPGAIPLAAPALVAVGP